MASWTRGAVSRASDLRPWSHHDCTTLTPLQPRARQVQSGMSGLQVAVRAGDSPFGRWLLPRVRQHLALSAVSWRTSDLHGAVNTEQLQRQNFCKFLTPMCLHHQAVQVGTGVRAVLPYGWEGNWKPGRKWWQPTTGFHEVYGCVSLWVWWEIVAAHHRVHD